MTWFRSPDHDQDQSLGPMTEESFVLGWAWGPLLERDGYSRDHGLRGVLRADSVKRPPEFAVIPSLRTQNSEKWCELPEHPWLVSSGNVLQVQNPSSPLKTLLLLEHRFPTCGSRTLGLQSTYLRYNL